MSIMRCERHEEDYDTDFKERCHFCELSDKLGLDEDYKKKEIEK